MAHAELREAVFRDLALLACVGVQPVVVHGGGPEINQWLKRLEIPAEFRDGLRVTDADTMDVVEMVLVGRVNKQIVNGLNQLGTRAIGLSGSDGQLVEARPWGDGSHGLVGDVARVNPDVLEPLLERVNTMLAASRKEVDEAGEEVRQAWEAEDLQRDVSLAKRLLKRAPARKAKAKKEENEAEEEKAMNVD